MTTNLLDITNTVTKLSIFDQSRLQAFSDGEVSPAGYLTLNTVFTVRANTTITCFLSPL